MRITVQASSNQWSGAALAASRQVWLAGLGAAVVSREWLGKEAGQAFRTLVREGTAVESRAIRLLGDQIENSVTRANALWRQTRNTVHSTVQQAAGTAVTFVKDTLPRVELVTKPGVKARPQPAAPAKRARKAVKPAARNTRRAKRPASTRA